MSSSNFTLNAVILLVLLFWPLPIDINEEFKEIFSSSKKDIYFSR